LEDEDLAQEIFLHLQSKSKYVCTMDIVQFLDTPEMKEWLNLKNLISEITACRMMEKMGYNWKRVNKKMVMSMKMLSLTDKMSFCPLLHPSDLKCTSGQNMEICKLSPMNQRVQMTLS